jgi:hypothetical protein
LGRVSRTSLVDRPCKFTAKVIQDHYELPNDKLTKLVSYDRMRTIWTGTDERGEIIWNAMFLDFARCWGFTPRLCRPYRAQTKGRIESGVKYVRRNFLCGLLGREPASLTDLNAELRRWVAEVANQRVHGTTREQVLLRFDEDQFAMQMVNGRPDYPFVDDELV